MYRADIIAAAWALSAAGGSPREVAEALGVGRSTVQRWLAGDVGALVDSRAGTAAAGCSSRCRVIEDLPAETYAFLLGLYLGDGHISTGRNGVHRLTISCADDYPDILRACADAMAAVMPQSKVGFAQKPGCVAVNSYSMHWVCLFPQHGAGKKHERAIVLRPWQEAIVAAHPAPLVRGLIQSDGCRVMNRVQRQGLQQHVGRRHGHLH